MSLKKQILTGVLIALTFTPLVYLGSSYQSKPKPKAEAAKAQGSGMKPVCHKEIMAIDPDGQSVLKLPEGWEYVGNMDGVILVQKEKCEGYR